MIPLGVLASSFKPWSGLPNATFDATIGSSSTSDNQSSYNIGSGDIGSYSSTRVILISAFTNGTDANVTCTVGGQSATRISSIGGTNNQHLFYYNGTLTGSQTVTVSISGGANFMNGAVYKVTAPYQSTPFAANSASGTGVVTTTINDCPSGGLIMFFCDSNDSQTITASYSGNESVTTFFNQKFNNNNLYGLRQRATLTSGGSRTFTTNNTTATKYATAVVFR